MRVYSQRLIRRLRVLIPRLERQNVLAANIARHRPRNAIHIVQRLREVRHSTRTGSQRLQSFAPLATLSASQESNRIHRWPIRLLQPPRRLFQRLLTHIVLTIRDHQQHFLAEP
jgi:hypothetical protein